ncbi:MAG: site-specific DNA-methyltransferase, partial [Chloroflexi bacterium]|nr:site-specific DNA-methyltransferase [Chloroflexota bacterium]
MPTLDFKGKQHIYAHHLTVPHRPLVVDEARSVLPDTDPPQSPQSIGGKPADESPLPRSGRGGLGAGEDIPFTDQNLIIHGDNLHGLKALLPHYAGRVKCIYIDPPYNTGSQAWVWNDNVNSPMMQAWLKENKPVDGEDLERHDKWLCMMWPRLHLLRELLRDDGVIFVSIDHHEVHHLRMMMDEIFSEECFITCLAAVLNVKGSRDNRGFATTHESVLIYEKVAGQATLRDMPLLDSESREWIEDSEGWYKRGASLRYSGENAPREKRPNLFYPIFVDKSGAVSIKPNDDYAEAVWPVTNDGKEVTWRWGRERVEANPNEIIASRSGDKWVLHKKQRPSVGLGPSKKPKSTFYSPNYSSTTATNMVKQIFENNRVFDYPKSPYFVMDLLQIAGSVTNLNITPPPDGRSNEPDIILDSF